MPERKKTNIVFKVTYVVVWTVGYTIVVIVESVKAFFRGMRNMNPIEAQRKYLRKKGSY